MTRRSITVLTARSRIAALVFALACGACATAASRPDWEHRLQGNAVLMLGEVHDNPLQHQLRLESLRRAFAAGWRPTIAMEQFDRERQVDIDRARRERPKDAQYLIEAAAPSNGRPGGGWNWDLYRPFVALALEYDVPLIAVNLSSSDATKIVRGGYAAVFDAASIAALKLDQPVAPDWQAAQEREIDDGHCHMLAQAMWPQMAKAQFARDAVMAALLREHSQNGVVLLAGNGHVRRDIGVPRWLDGAMRERVFIVGYVESSDQSASAFDAVVQTAPAPRPDPCADFAKRRSAAPINSIITATN